MSTNYYARINRCSCCGRYDELHIGKSFRILEAHPERGISTFADWRELIDSPDVEIWDEYGALIEIDDSQGANAWLDRWDHYEDIDDWYDRSRYAKDYEAIGDYLDGDGYHFHEGEFS